MRVGVLAAGLQILMVLSAWLINNFYKKIKRLRCGVCFIKFFAAVKTSRLLSRDLQVFAALGSTQVINYFN